MTKLRFFVIFLLCLLLSGCTAEAPAPQETTVPVETAPEHRDFAAELKLDMSTDTAKQEVTVKTFIDGDTTHFHVPSDVMEDGVLKARFLAVNTPESTGKIEEYGKKAAEFTKERLSAATSILIESETSSWDPDSTGSRYLAWVWYKTEGMEDYRNLNVELLQNGLAIASSAAGNRYGDTCVAALEQARREKLHLYSGEKDPDFYYGEAVELTLKELRTNIEAYSGMKVAFSGIVSANSGTQGVYVEDYDPETELYYGMYIYYGHGLSGPGLDVLTVGNEARIVGTVQYYEGGGTWQVSDLSYRLMKPDDPGNVQKLSEGHSAAYVLTSADTFVNGRAGDMDYAAAVMGTSLEMQNLKVLDIYTTDLEDSSSRGAMTLTCESEGVTVTVRTSPMLDENGDLITKDTYLGKTISVKGIVEFFDGAYQIRVFAPTNITIQD